MTFARRCKFFLVRKLARLLILALCGGSRRNVHGREHLADLPADAPRLYIFWHCHIFHVIYQFRGSGAAPLISMSSDGEIVAAIAEEFGMHPVRGSSSRGGARAFLQMLQRCRRPGAEVLITADGPKGPAREVKPGAVQLARKSGAVLVPIAWYSSRVKIFARSWDRFLMPRLGGRLHFAYGRPLRLESGADAPDDAQYGRLLQQALNELEESMKRSCAG